MALNELPELSNLTATAILGWYAWHTAARAIPGLVRVFRDELAAMRQEYRDEREALRAELNADRNQRHADHLMIVEALHELACRLPVSEHATSWPRPAGGAVRG